ncbi:hypothetical protein [Entomobacter blattae]|uniref:Uncharacterized protein n=1 Tax=Entomobacter blattae TaxID=2762277 RepID=A0A7H1NTU1_9PROT|nr:hypothetical protein [Entomobacter blattae]QNT79201.1 hypothetical protein JGUZn3_19960 [Entomobacter blattae]
MVIRFGQRIDRLIEIYKENLENPNRDGRSDYNPIQEAITSMTEEFNLVLSEAEKACLHQYLARRTSTILRQ